MHAPLQQTYRVERRDIADLAAVAGEWRELAAQAAEPNVFYEPEFMLAAAPVFGANASAILVHTADSRLVGVFPLHVAHPRGGLLRFTTGWTHPFAPLGTPLVHRADPEGIVAAWLDYLGKDSSLPSFALLPFLPDRGPFATALDAVLAKTGQAHIAFDSHRRAMLDPEQDRGHYLESTLSAGRRKELRRQLRRLEDSGPVTFVTAVDGRDADSALREFMALELAGWKGRSGTAIANDPAVSKFAQTAISKLTAIGGARIDRMLAGERTIAAAVTLQSGSMAWCWKIAYDETHARSSPGVQLIFHLTERLLDEQAPVRVDSCATADHPMIDHIWRERLALSDRLIALRPSVVPFALVCKLETFRRGTLAAAKSLRDRLRQT